MLRGPGWVTSSRRRRGASSRLPDMQRTHQTVARAFKVQNSHAAVCDNPAVHQFRCGLVAPSTDAGQLPGDSVPHPARVDRPARPAYRLMPALRAQRNGISLLGVFDSSARSSGSTRFPSLCYGRRASRPSATPTARRPARSVPRTAETRAHGSACGRGPRPRARRRWRRERG